MATPFYFTPNAPSLVFRYVDSSGIIHTPSLTSTDAVFNSNVGVNIEYTGMCFDASGNLYIGDRGGAALYQISPSFVATHIVGKVGTFSQQGIPGVAASASLPVLSVAIDSAGNLYLTGVGAANIFCVNMQSTTQTICNVSIPAGNIQSIAGTGVNGFSGDGGQATSAKISNNNNSNMLAVDPSGNVFFAGGDNRIRKIDHASGIINTVIGTGVAGSSGDGGPATSATIFNQGAVVCDSQGNVIWSQTNLIRAANFSGAASILGVSIAIGTVGRISGQGSSTQGTEGYAGDGGAATGATLGVESCLAIDPATGTLGMGFGNINLANEARIRAITTAGVINTIAGNGTSGTTGDGGSALTAEIQSPLDGIAFPPTPSPYTVSPPCTSFGSQITVTPGFAGAVSVTVGGLPATVIVSSPASVTFLCPGSGPILINGTLVGSVCPPGSQGSASGGGLPPCAPANSVFLPKYSLAMAPMTQKFQHLIPVGVINLSDTTNEGRDAIVLDFNNGDGIYSVDIGTAFTWPMNGSPKPILRVWQPSLIPMPEQVFDRPSDWDDGGTPGAKFIQGVVVEADSFNLPKTFQLQSSDDLSLHALNEMPATFPKQTTIAFSCVTPFVSHSVRIFATDGVAWRVWKNNLVFEPWPEQTTNWQTEQVSLGITGWAHAREFNLAYASATPITVMITFDAWPTITFTLPSSGGALVQAKTKNTLPPNKFKLIGVRIFSTAPFYLFEQDLELKVKQWGSTGPYSVIKIAGGPSKSGAKV
jgi:hypothetical protein